MQIRPISWALFAAALALLVLMGTLDAFRFLWVFPLDTAGLPLWMVVCGVDILLARAFPSAGNARLLLWCSGLLYFAARQNIPLVGLALIFGSAALWVAERLRFHYLPLAAVIGATLLAFGHEEALLNPGMADRVGDFRFSLHLIASFSLFRMISWGIAVRKRGAKPDFLLTMEYFLAPAFWLSPMHAAHLLFDHMQKPAIEVSPERALGWLIRGFLHALVFSVVVSFVMPEIQAHFEAGLSSFRWWHWGALGPMLFLAAYLEKSRVSYVVAGCLSLVGHDVEPDFRAPWLARSLLEYWRRFHFWIWEYYIDLIYMPLASLLVRRLPPRVASILALFLTFTIGTSVIHWVHYPAPFLPALALGFLFGAFSVLHGLFSSWLRNSLVGIPCTWLTVFFLYALAYPAFGLGWGWPELIQFFQR